MICPNCGENIPDGNSFCIKCGAKMNAASNAGNYANYTENTNVTGRQKSGYGNGGGYDQGGSGYGWQDGGYGGQNGSGQTGSDFGGRDMFGPDSGSQGGFGADSGVSGSQGGFGADSNSFFPQNDFNQSGGSGSQGGFGSDSNSFFPQNDFNQSGGSGSQGGFGSDSNSFFPQNDFDQSGSFFGEPDGSYPNDTMPSPGNNPFDSPMGDPYPSDYSGKGSHSGKGGLPKPAIIAICAASVVLLLAVAAFILDYSGVVKVPVVHDLIHRSEKAEPGDSDGEDPDGEDPDGEDPDGEDPDGEDPDGEDPDDEDPDDEDPDPKKSEPVTLSLSVTDVEPPELSGYHKVSVKGLDAAPGAEGTTPSNMISDNDDVWRTEVRNIYSEDGKNIRMTFQKSKIVAVEIKAGNWSSKELYNMDSRPTKIYLTLGGHSYPLSLNDKQVVHYIVFSNPVEISELSMSIGSYSNDTTGYFAITNISVYSE